MTAFSSAKVEIEFTPGTWTDVTAYWAPPITITQGRATEFDEVSPGSTSVSLRNMDGRFMPENPSSPYYPNVVEGVRVRISMVKGGVTYQRFVGYVQAWEPSWPGDEGTAGIVTISAIDSLGVVGKQTLTSTMGLTSTALALAATYSTWADVWDITGGTTWGVTTNVSSGVSTVSYVSGASFTYGTDAAITEAGYMKVPATASNYQANWVPRSGTAIIEFLVNVNGYNNGGAAQYLCSIQNAGGTLGIELGYNPNTGQLFWFNYSGFISDAIGGPSIATGWHKVSMKGNGTSIDTYIDDVYYHTTTLFNWTTLAKFNVWTDLLGQLTNQSIAGVMFAGDVNVSVPMQYSIAASTWTVAQRLTSVQTVIAPFNPGFQTVGSDSAQQIASGNWVGLDPLTFLKTIARTNGSIVWVRWDGQVLYLHPDVLYPLAPLLTLDSEADLSGAPTLKRAADSRPTRVTVSTPANLTQTVWQAIDSVSEAANPGGRHDISISALSASQAAATALGWSYMATAPAMRMTQIVLDLLAPGTDYTATLFDQSATQGALYPTQRVRVTVPSSIWGVSSRDLFVQGWTETYDWNAATLALDCSPANVATVTGGTCVGSTSTGTVVITSTRPLTTTAQAYPMDLDWAGERVTVSAPGGATSPQTCTVTARGVTGGTAAAAHASGTSIDVWHSAAS